MDFTDLVPSVIRWIHIIAGITWIGILYFFNWVNSQFAPTMDGETKQKVIPELMPRALYFFRWGAAFTWLTGVLLLYFVFWAPKVAFDDPTAATHGAGFGIGLAIVFLGVFVYDNLCGGPIKDNKNAFWAGVIWSGVLALLLQYISGFGARGQMIHLGAFFGTNMAFNVWFRIWPAQQRIITAIKNGDAPNPDDGALAGTRSKHNTYMSVPLVMMMINNHAIWDHQHVVADDARGHAGRLRRLLLDLQPLEDREGLLIGSG